MKEKEENEWVKSWKEKKKKGEKKKRDWKEEKESKV